MTRKTPDAGDSNPRQIKSIDSLNDCCPHSSVQARPEPASVAGRVSRAADDGVDGAAALAQLLRRWTLEYDEPARPAPVPGFFAPGTPEYALEGLGSSQEWLVVPDHIVKNAGEMR